MNNDIDYIPNFFSKELSNHCLDTFIKDIEWHNVLKNKEGQDVKIKRSMAYETADYVEGDFYEYSVLRLPATYLTPHTEIIMNMLNDRFGYGFNSCLFNLYKNGKEAIGWHSDDEKQLGDKPIIAMLSFGSSRTFNMMDKETKEKTKFLLNNGDLFIMKENCQKNHQHSVLQEKQVTTPRLSLTFRKVIK